MQFLVVLKLIPGVPRELLAPHLHLEAETVWNLYKSDIVRSFYLSQNPPGAILTVETKDRSEVEKLLAELPLVQIQALSVEIFDLNPFTALAALFAVNPTEEKR